MNELETELIDYANEKIDDAREDILEKIQWIELAMQNNQENNINYYDKSKEYYEVGTTPVAEENNTEIIITDDIGVALENVDAVFTDVWVSMGDEAEKAQREKDFAPFQVNSDLMALANDGAIFMHCLPAIRGREVTSDVIDGPQSVIYDEAENRMHAQKAVLYYYLKD
jgi:ornithine carbamoyltransferase